MVDVVKHATLGWHHVQWPLGHEIGRHVHGMQQLEETALGFGAGAGERATSPVASPRAYITPSGTMHAATTQLREGALPAAALIRRSNETKSQGPPAPQAIAWQMNHPLAKGRAGP